MCKGGRGIPPQLACHQWVIFLTTFPFGCSLGSSDNIAVLLSPTLSQDSNPFLLLRLLASYLAASPSPIFLPAGRTPLVHAGNPFLGSHVAGRSDSPDKPALGSSHLVSASGSHLVGKEGSWDRGQVVAAGRRDTQTQDCHDVAAGMEEAPGSHAEEGEEEWCMRRTEGLVLVVAAGR